MTLLHKYVCFFLNFLYFYRGGLRIYFSWFLYPFISHHLKTWCMKNFPQFRHIYVPHDMRKIFKNPISKNTLAAFYISVNGAWNLHTYRSSCTNGVLAFPIIVAIFQSSSSNSISWVSLASSSNIQYGSQSSHLWAMSVSFIRSLVPPSLIILPCSTFPFRQPSPDCQTVFC